MIGAVLFGLAVIGAFAGAIYAAITAERRAADEQMLRQYRNRDGHFR